MKRGRYEKSRQRAGVILAEAALMLRETGRPRKKPGKPREYMVMAGKWEYSLQAAIDYVGVKMGKAAWATAREAMVEEIAKTMPRMVRRLESQGCSNAEIIAWYDDWQADTRQVIRMTRNVAKRQLGK